MLALSPFRNPEPGVADLLPWATLMDDGLVINKDGSLMAGWMFKGPDVASLTPAMKNAITRHLNNAGLMGDGFAFWFETVRMPAADYPSPELSHFPDPVSALIDEERRRQFMAEGAQYETGQAVILVYRPPIRHQSRLISGLYSGGGEAAPVGDQQVEIFQRACQQLEDILGDVLLNFRRLGGIDYVDRNDREHHQDALVNLLHRCLTGEDYGLNIPPGAMHLDGIIGGQELWTGDMLKLGERFIACVSIEGFPAESYPFILDELSDLPFAYRFSSRFILLSGPEGKRELGRTRRKWRQRMRGFTAQIFRTQGGWINEDAALMARQTDAALTDAESGMLAFGYYTPVIELRGKNLAALGEQARVLVRNLARLGFAARLETVNATEAFLGTLPGHVHPNVRRPLIHSLNFADLLPVSSPYTGVAYNPNPLFPPNSPPLAVVATGGATPLYYNIHQADVGHTLVFGPTGAGKSVHLAQMVASFKRYENATITVFDKGWSMYALGALTGGAHYALAAEEGSPGLCPLAFLDDAGDVAWAEDWLATCYELQTGEALTPAQKGEIHRAVTSMAGTGRDESRSLSDFLNTVQDTEIRDALRAYSLDGPLGELLDASEDSLSANPFLVFELDELMAMPPATLIPVLLYLFRRIEKRLTGTPALLVLDEAWVMLGHPVFAAKIREWLKTMRKANCAVVMATQSLSDAWRSGLIDVLIESCPTRIFLGNPEAHMRGQGDVAGPHDIYAAFGLNDVQIDIIQNARAKRQFYYTSPEGNRLCDLTLGPVARAVTAVSSKEDVTALRTLAAEYEGETLVREWLASKGVTIDANTD